MDVFESGKAVPCLYLASDVIGVFPSDHTLRSHITPGAAECLGEFTKIATESQFVVECSIFSKWRHRGFPHRHVASSRDVTEQTVPCQEQTAPCGT